MVDRGPSEEAASSLRRQLRASRLENEQLRLRIADLEADLAASRTAGSAPSRSGVSAEVADSEVSSAGDKPDEKDKQRLLRHLEGETYARLGPSRIAGVGVFAIRPIPAGVDPFPNCNDHLGAKERFAVCSESELRHLPPQVLEQVKSFFAPFTEDDNWEPQRTSTGEVLYGVLATGLNALNVSWYLNHSEDPNIGFKEAEEDDSFNSFVTRRRVEEGEELTTDYRDLGKEFFALVSRP
mmetsp:Transcript_54158/g.116977  ORF Transcript_54158/g.116977 Transcript_54158/m.116977 type:complete len:239 (+) Transcript_54158:32-748(+)